MSQQGQLFRLKLTGREGEPLWAYRYLLERVPNGQPAEPRTWRKDDYPD